MLQMSSWYKSDESTMFIDLFSWEYNPECTLIIIWLLIINIFLQCIKINRTRKGFETKRQSWKG